MRNGRAKPVGLRKGGEGDVSTGQKKTDAMSAAKLIGEHALREGSGTTGADGATPGEQHTQWSSGRLVLCKPTPEAPCKSKTTNASEEHEFIGALGSHRS